MILVGQTCPPGKYNLNSMLGLRVRARPRPLFRPVGRPVQEEVAKETERLGGKCTGSGKGPGGPEESGAQGQGEQSTFLGLDEGWWGRQSHHLPTPFLVENSYTSLCWHYESIRRSPSWENKTQQSHRPARATFTFWYTTLHSFVCTSSEVMISLCSLFGIQHFSLKIILWIFHTIILQNYVFTSCVIFHHHVLAIPQLWIIFHLVLYKTWRKHKRRNLSSVSNSSLIAKSQVWKCLCPSETAARRVTVPSAPRVGKATNQKATHPCSLVWWQVFSLWARWTSWVCLGRESLPLAAPPPLRERLGRDWARAQSHLVLFSQYLFPFSTQNAKPRRSKTARAAVQPLPECYWTYWAGLTLA